jgi:hypothetical protein
VISLVSAPHFLFAFLIACVLIEACGRQPLGTPPLISLQEPPNFLNLLD